MNVEGVSRCIDTKRVKVEAGGLFTLFIFLKFSSNLLHHLET